MRSGKTHLIESAMQTSKDIGMMTIEESLADLVKAGMVTVDDAKGYALHPEDFQKMII
jgi:twitching motility protein PilT